MNRLQDMKIYELIALMPDLEENDDRFDDFLREIGLFPNVVLVINVVPMVHYKLTYFDIRGRAEHIRMLFHYAGQDFEDRRVPYTKARDGKEWQDLKPHTPFGQIPVLYVDGKPLAQTFAIARYVGRQFGLAGKDDWESGQLDSIADFHKDFTAAIAPYFRVVAGFLPGDKDKLYNDLYQPEAEKHYSKLEQLLKKSGSGFFAKSGPTWVDFYIAEDINTQNGYAPEFFEKHPEIWAFLERVHNLPKVKEYVQSMKKFEF